jgi:hypothetical protein
MIGYIIKNKQTAIGIETTGAPLTYIAIESSFVAKPGATLPRTIPPTMQRPTQTVKYLSKKPIPVFSIFSMSNPLEP